MRDVSCGRLEEGVRRICKCVSSGTLALLDVCTMMEWKYLILTSAEWRQFMVHNAAQFPTTTLGKPQQDHLFQVTAIARRQLLSLSPSLKPVSKEVAIASLRKLYTL